jgi:hypothetical protein
LIKQSHITLKLQELKKKKTDAAAIITMTTNTAANTLESQHLTTTDVEEGDGLIIHQSLPRDPAVDVWNRGFCLFCVASSDISGPVGGVAIHWNNSPL